MSKTKILIFAVIFAAAAGGYWFTQQPSFNSGSSSGAAQSTLLNRVPADTVMFFGGLETMPFVNPYDAELIKEFQSSIKDQFKQLEEMNAGKKSPAAIMLMNLYVELTNQLYMENMSEMNDFAVYALGVYPVAVWKSTDIQGFTSQLNNIEKENNITSRQFKLGEASLREYLVDESAPVKMYIAINGDVVSLGATSEKEEILNLLAGVNYPEKNMGNSNKLKDLKSAHALLPFALGFMDIDTAVKNLASTENNLLKQTLQDFSQSASIPDVTANACFNDAAKIIARWPRMVFGYRSFNIDSNPVTADAAFIFEHTDNKFLAALKSISGSLPEYSFEHDVMSMGIGINIDNIATFVNDFRSDILKESYQCEDLLALQQQAKESNPGMLTMGTQMVAGVQGISVHITKFDIEGVTNNDMKSVEGMAVITAKNPKNLLMAASSFYPPLNQLNLEANGESKTLTLPMGITADIAMSDSAVTLQFGQSDSISKRIADIHQGKGLSSNLMSSGMDLSAYFKMLEPMLDDALNGTSEKEAEQMKQMFNMFEKLDMKFVYDINVEDKGIALNFKMSMKNTAK